MEKILLISLPATGKTTARKIMNESYEDRTQRPCLDWDLKGRNFKNTSTFRDASTCIVREAFDQGCSVVFTHCGFIQPQMIPDDVTIYYVIPTSLKLCEAVEDAAVRDKKDKYTKRCFFSKDYEENKWRWRQNQVREAVLCKHFHDNTKVIMLPDGMYIKDLFDLKNHTLNEWVLNELVCNINIHWCIIDFDPMYVHTDNRKMQFEKLECCYNSIMKSVELEYFTIPQDDFVYTWVLACYNYAISHNLKQYEIPLTKYAFRELSSVVKRYFRAQGRDFKIPSLKDR